MFWSYQGQEIEQVNDFKNHQLPLARIKKIMKVDEDVCMISAEAPILFPIRMKVGWWGLPPVGCHTFYPPMDKPAGGALAGMMIGRPTVDPTTGIYAQPPSQAWQSVWQTAGAEDASYDGGGNETQGNLDGQGVTL
ncbi:Nuclear transcription factor Y subunit C-4 [Hibiscus syriacus]|uniref:Nuclear transcription factor Y subunit C-4 n=1 Tax=Hibiscus syriacus TaxID=106335 RepID=A0A6A3APD0_HIBSY|nr:Nuclear transcription factor Y subunit C-4 [Hibiscus syriacus]